MKNTKIMSKGKEVKINKKIEVTCPQSYPWTCNACNRNNYGCERK